MRIEADAILTYDQRLSVAARSVGLDVMLSGAANAKSRLRRIRRSICGLGSSFKPGGTHSASLELRVCHELSMQVPGSDDPFHVHLRQCLAATG